MCEDYPSCPPVTPKRGCKSFYCDIASTEWWPRNPTSITVAYVSDPIKVNSHDPVTMGGQYYSITYEARLYSYLNPIADGHATFKIGAVFLNGQKEEIGRDEEIHVETVGGPGSSETHDYQGETRGFYELPGTQYIRIYAFIEAAHMYVYPDYWAQVGAMVDCLQLRSNEQVLSVEDGPRGPGENPLQVQCHPNPFNRSVDISFLMPRAGSVGICLFDIIGRQVRRYSIGGLSAGRQSFHWDGRDDNSRALPSGVYAYRIATGSLNAVGKVVMAR
jgi:hypothetical protein